jgi:hypothetical protein
MTAAIAVPVMNRRREYPVRPQQSVTAVRPPRDEPADDDELHAVTLQRAFGPVAGCLALRRGEEPALHDRAEAAAEQVGDVVAQEGARGCAEDQQGDPRIRASRGRHAEGDDGGLARYHRDYRVECGEDERDQVGDGRVDLEAGENAHLSPG